MTPTPAIVRAWFAGDIDTADLAAYIKAVRADHNWRVIYIPGPPTSTVGLTFWPTGERLTFALRRVGAGRVWRNVA